MIIKGTCRDFRIIEKSSRNPSMFSSNIIRSMLLKHTWSLTIYGGRLLNFRIYFWIRVSLDLVKCGISCPARKNVRIDRVSTMESTLSPIQGHNFIEGSNLLTSISREKCSGNGTCWFCFVN
jgi:hypothetical protein